MRKIVDTEPSPWAPWHNGEPSLPATRSRVRSFNYLETAWGENCAFRAIYASGNLPAASFRHRVFQAHAASIAVRRVPHCERELARKVKRCCSRRFRQDPQSSGHDGDAKLASDALGVAKRVAGSPGSTSHRIGLRRPPRLTRSSSAGDDRQLPTISVWQR